MRIQRDDDQDIRTLIERGSSTWAGPSPSARQARWAAEDRPRRWVRAGMAAVGFGVAAFLTGSLTLLATSQSPDGAAASVMRLVSHVFTTPVPAPAASPVPSPPAAAPPAPAGAPTPTGARPATARPTQRPSPEPSDDQWGHHPSPSPSPSGPSSPGPSPSPSRPPDE